jgi:hypothetical protein
MIQEIITYMIIGSAITFTLIKTFNTLRKKKKKKTADYKNLTISNEHNCPDCPAECMLRNAAQNNPKSNEALCENVNTKSN